MTLNDFVSGEAVSMNTILGTLHQYAGSEEVAPKSIVEDKVAPEDNRLEEAIFKDIVGR